MYSIYLTDNAKEEMQTKSPQELERISERLIFLRNGQWKNGTRVKKLKGVNKLPIYEARIDKSNRMLFTPILTDTTGQKRTSLMIFNLSVEHDKVIRTAKAFLGEKFDEDEYTLAEETSETLEEIIQETIATWQPQYDYLLMSMKKYDLNEDTLIRFMQNESVSSEEFWNIKLQLTKEQQSVVMCPLPLLISGTAGSGKTTIVIHKLLTEPYEKKVYISYTKELVQEAERQFLSLIKGIDEEKQYKKNTSFLTFENILKTYKEDEFLSYMTRERFLYEYNIFSRSKQLSRKFPPLMIWEEIRSVWKSGAYTPYDKEMSLSEYIDLSEQEAPNFFGNREQAYEIFVWYMKWLKENCVVDEQDLLKGALKNLGSSYDLVICDEVQDLSMLHIYFVFALANYEAKRIILTGDDHQVIHHSGFRWENIKKAFYQKLDTSINKIVKLSKNFRNQGKIAKLAIAINEFQKEYTDFQYKDKQTDFYDYGVTPILYKSLEEEELLSKVKEFGPYDAVLVRNEAERLKLTNRCFVEFGKTPLIFTISQSKGLEFQRVLLWSLIPNKSEEELMWNKIYRIIDSDKQYLLEKNSIYQRFIRHETSLLYVAVTRGIKECFIYDGSHTSIFWKIKDISQNLQVVTQVHWKETEISQLNDIDWLSQGEKFLKRQLFYQALECFNRVPVHLVNRLKLICEAHIAKEEDDYAQAAEKFKLAKCFKESLHCLDVRGEYEKAQHLCESVILENKENESEIVYWEYQKKAFRVKEFDQKKKWIGSAIYCKEIGKYIEAANRFEKANPNFASNMFLHQLFDEVTNSPPIEADILARAINFYKITKNREKLSMLTSYKNAIG